MSTEVKMPVAEEEAERILRGDGPVRLWERIADIQRRTLLAAAAGLTSTLGGLDGDGNEVAPIHDATRRKCRAELERSADSLGAEEP